jgi:lysozyme
MRLIDSWRVVLRRAWSIRLILLAALLSGLEVALPILDGFLTLKVGQKFSESECNTLIAGLIPRYAAPVQKCIPSFSSMPPHRQAALISFAINLGPGVARGSVARLLNAGLLKDACNKMREYVFANGKRLQGLANRRNDPVWGERAWCLRED